VHIDVIRGYDENVHFDDMVLKYSVLFTANDKRKTIGTFTPFRWLGDVYICGYFLSPFENRALEIIAEDLGGTKMEAYCIDLAVLIWV
jgi:hypothetical protein